MTPESSRDVLNGNWSDHEAPIDDCQICQRFQPLVWHCTQSSAVDRAKCRQMLGSGLWVCSLCEEALHRWMRQHPSEKASEVAVTALLDRLTERLLGPRRKYRKRRGDEQYDE